MRFIPVAPVLAVVFAGLFTFDTAAAAPSGLPDRALDLDLKQASVTNVFRLLSQVAQREFHLDACVQGTVDLRLKNTPLPLVLDALAAKLHLAYEDDSGAIRVICTDQDSGAPSTDATKRFSLTEHDAPLGDVLTRLAADAKLGGVDYKAKAQPHVDVTLSRVKLTTALAALSDTSGVKVSVANRRLVVTD